jgi:hypothetical protein
VVDLCWFTISFQLLGRLLSFLSCSANPVNIVWCVCVWPRFCSSSNRRPCSRSSDGPAWPKVEFLPTQQARNGGRPSWHFSYHKWNIDRKKNGPVVISILPLFLYFLKGDCCCYIRDERALQQVVPPSIVVETRDDIELTLAVGFRDRFLVWQSLLFFIKKKLLKEEETCKKKISGQVMYGPQSSSHFSSLALCLTPPLSLSLPPGAFTLASFNNIFSAKAACLCYMNAWKERETIKVER